MAKRPMMPLPDEDKLPSDLPRGPGGILDMTERIQAARRKSLAIEDMPTYRAEMGRRIKETRRARDFTIEALSEETGIPARMLEVLEAGVRFPKNKEVFNRLGEALSVDPIVFNPKLCVGAMPQIEPLPMPQPPPEPLPPNTVIVTEDMIYESITEEESSERESSQSE